MAREPDLRAPRRDDLRRQLAEVARLRIEERRATHERFVRGEVQEHPPERVQRARDRFSYDLGVYLERRATELLRERDDHAVGRLERDPRDGEQLLELATRRLGHRRERLGDDLRAVQL